MIADISMSLDGYVAGSDASREEPLGTRGSALHEWAFSLRDWREPHGREGGVGGSVGDRMTERLAATGAVIMGRRMFSGGAGPWEDDSNADGW